MSDERFTLVKKGNGWVIDDSSRVKFYLTPNETVKLLNVKDKTIKELKEENEQLRHELDSLTGCYCADNKEFKDYWRIGYDD